MRRFGQLIRLKPGSVTEYERLHADVWPDVLDMIRRSNIRNYSIYRHDDLLFAYFEYDGADFEGDMATMAADPATQRWWAINKPLQDPFPERGPGEWWTTMREIFHTD